MLKLKKIFFRDNETFSDNDNEIRIHFLYAGEEYLFCYLGKETSIIHKDTNEIIIDIMLTLKNKKKANLLKSLMRLFLKV